MKLQRLIRLREVRERRQLTQYQLAKKLRTDQALVSKWETGAVRPFPNTITRIAQALGVAERELM